MGDGSMTRKNEVWVDDKYLGCKSDPDLAVDYSKPSPPSMFGWWGPYPSCPCRECGNDIFRTMDWGMGYRCTNCGASWGLKSEWDWYLGQ